MKGAVGNRIDLVTKQLPSSQEEIPADLENVHAGRLQEKLSQEAVPHTGRRKGVLDSGLGLDAQLPRYS